MKLNTRCKIFNDPTSLKVDLLFLYKSLLSCTENILSFCLSTSLPFDFSIFHFHSPYPCFSSRSIASHILLSLSFSFLLFPNNIFTTFPSFPSPSNLPFIVCSLAGTQCVHQRSCLPLCPLPAPQFSISCPIALEDFPTGVCLHLFKHSIIYTRPRQRTSEPFVARLVSIRV